MRKLCSIISSSTSTQREMRPLTREDTVAHLMDLGVKPADARAHIEQLLLEGCLYEVDDELRIPSRP